jgi:hypothetical protein
MNKNIVFLLLLLLLCSGTLYAQNADTKEPTTPPANSSGNSGSVHIDFFEKNQTQPQRAFTPYTFLGAEYLPRFAVKTNLLYGATATINLGVEFLLNKHLTLDISGGWNPFIYSNNKKFAHYMVQPTLRYWIQEPFNGHFIGASLIYSNFNVAGIDLPFNIMPALANHRFRGDAYGASFQYGHQWLLSPRWGIETTLNVGYMYLDYQKFECGWCGELIGNEKKHYLGPTNASISLIYIIK